MAITEAVAYAERIPIVRRQIDHVQGHEGKQLEAKFREILTGLGLSVHWKTLLKEENATNLQLEDLAYGPAKRTYSKRVRYRYVGRGTPLPYEVDEIVEE